MFLWKGNFSSRPTAEATKFWNRRPSQPCPIKKCHAQNLCSSKCCLYMKSIWNHCVKCLKVSVSPHQLIAIHSEKSKKEITNRYFFSKSPARIQKVYNTLSTNVASKSLGKTYDHGTHQCVDHPVLRCFTPSWFLLCRASPWSWPKAHGHMVHPLWLFQACNINLWELLRKVAL